jgi:catechol 2,3-dioxygenase-like lactoylglutathione lyase family enzyme
MTKKGQKHMRLGKFSLCLNVKNLQTSKSFYETLGFEVRGGNEADHWLLMSNGEAYIGLMQGMFEKNMLTFVPNQDGNGQELPKFTDIRDIQKQLKQAGIAFEQEADGGTGPTSFLVQDPDGNPIMVDQYVTSSK